MKVKIVKCSDNQWYTKRIGETYEVDEECNTNYYSLTNGTLILKADTIPVNEIRYEKKAIYFTECPNGVDCKVGCEFCNKCKYFIDKDWVNQTVQCSWQVGDTVVVEGFKGMKKSYVKEEGKEMKRLNIRKDYEDSKIEIVTCCSDRGLDYSRVRVLNDSEIIMRVGEGYSTTLDQANAILKVMGLNYELYEVDWNKVEEGAEVVFWLTFGNLKGQVIGKFNSYIPSLKKIVVICGEKVNVVDEDKVELC